MGAFFMPAVLVQPAVRIFAALKIFAGNYYQQLRSW